MSSSSKQDKSKSKPKSEKSSSGQKHSEKSKSSSSSKVSKPESKSSSKPENKVPKETKVPKEPKETVPAERYMYPKWDVFLGESELQGLGVFAGRDFKKDETVEICPYLKIYKGHMNDECEVGDYTFEFDDESEVLIQGYGSMYNHHKDNNIDYIYDEGDDMFEFVALRDIKKGEELTVNYGDDYWNAREEDPLN